MLKKRVLFLCVHNSARSQMAAAFLNQLAGDRFEAESAGLEPRALNPLAVEAMRRIGIDIDQAKTQSVFDLFKAGRRFYYVISVCDEASAEKCPVFAGITKRLSWSFDDPAGFAGTDEEKQRETSRVRVEIREKVVRWVAEEAKTPARKGRPERPRRLRA
jgi:arsenate reductase